MNHQSPNPIDPVPPLVQIGVSAQTSNSPPESDSPDLQSNTPPNLSDTSKKKSDTSEKTIAASNADNSIDADSAPMDLVQWGLERFAEQPIVLTTSFGMEGCVLMDMCSKAIANGNLENITVACIDTGFFFPETKQLRKKLIERYTNLNFVTWETPVSIEQQRETYGDMLWKNNPNMCCNIRKVQPMRENIVNYRLWITALRRTQTKQRADTPVIGWDWKYKLLKFCPLATLSRADVWQYIQENEVPFNQLHLQNYPSVSCFHCTKPVPDSNPDSEVRKGRWAGSDKDECGLHFSI
ncbi:MAG: phosphoadenylyl-sulfate reductase [Mariniblastus sp.]